MACSGMVHAQEVKTTVPVSASSESVAAQAAAPMGPMTENQVVKPRRRDFLTADTLLTLPPMNSRGGWATGSYYRGGCWGPWDCWNDWRLHEGLNVSLSASATVGWGKYALSGFSQGVSMMYAVPLSPKVSLAIGGYYSHFNLGHTDFNDAGVNAVLGYKMNDRWEAYVYAQKSVVTPRVPRPLYDFTNIGDKIGAEVRYNLSPSTSIGVSVWFQNVPDGPRPPRYFDVQPDF